MKSFITKLSAIVLVGVLALTGCTKELEKQVANLQTETESLWNEVKALKSSLESTYVTKAELQALTSDLAAVKAAIEAKADKTTLETAIAGLEAQLKGFATVETLNALSSKVDDLKAAIDAIENCECDLTAVNASISALENTLSSYTAKTDETLKNIQDELAKINSEAFLAEVYKYIDTKDQAILDQIADLAKQLADANQAIIDAAAKAEAALKAAEGTTACAADEVRKEFKAADAALASRISAVESRLSSLESKLNNAGCSCNFQSAINDLTSKYGTLNSQITDLYNKFNSLQNAPRSVVLVPELIVNGMPTVEFDILTYGNAGFASAVAHACYLVNPSNASFSADILSVISHEAKTKATEAAVEIVDEVTACENAGEYKVNFRLANLDENMFALAVESLDAVIYSDYAQITYNKTNASELVFNGAEVSILPSKTVTIADHVAVKDFDLAAYGLEYAYEVTEGKVTVVGGVVYATAEAEGKNVVAVKIVNGEDVVRVAELIVNVEATGTFEHATATVEAKAERVAFEASDVKTWLVNLKNEPNTIELIKQATKAAINKNYAEAYNLLGGVPGFVYKNTTFTGNGEATVKVEVATKADATVPSIDFDELYNKIASMVDLTDALALFTEIVKNHPEETETILNAVKEIADKIDTPSGLAGILVGTAKETLKSITPETLVKMLQSEEIRKAISLVANYIDKETVKEVAKKVIDAIKEKVEANTPSEPETPDTPDTPTEPETPDTPDTPVEPEEPVVPEDKEYTEAQRLAIDRAGWDLVSNLSDANADITVALENGAWGQLAKAAQFAALVSEKIDVATLNKIVDSIPADKLVEILSNLPQEVRDLINTITNIDFGSVLDKIPVEELKNLINSLPAELKDLLSKLPVEDLKDLLTKLPNLDTDTIIKDVVENAVQNATKEDIKNVINTLPEETVENLVNEFAGRDDITMEKINEVLDDLTDEEIREIISTIPEEKINDLIEKVLPDLNLEDILGALTTKADSTIDIKDVLAKLNTEQLKALLNNIPVEDLLANIQLPDVDLKALIEKLPAEVKAAIEQVSVKDFSTIIEQIPVAQIKAIASQLSEKAQAVIAQLPVEKIKAALYKLADTDIKTVLDNITKEDIKAVINMLPEAKDALNGLVEKGYDLAMWKSETPVVTYCESTFETIE